MFRKKVVRTILNCMSDEPYIIIVTSMEIVHKAWENLNA